MKDVYLPGPHQGQSVLTAGEELEQARQALILVHGRGADAASILSLADVLDEAESGWAYLAPQAAGNTWYPNRFLAPLESNEPWLSSALAVLESLLEQVERAGIPPERTMLLGFSQGACLALEFAARHAQRYAGLVGLSGGLIGPDGTQRDYAGTLAGTPVFLGCSDVDPHIPKARVQHTAEVLQNLGGQVTTRLYANFPHAVNQDESDFVRQMMSLLR